MINKNDTLNIKNPQRIKIVWKIVTRLNSSSSSCLLSYTERKRTLYFGNTFFVPQGTLQKKSKKSGIPIKFKVPDYICLRGMLKAFWPQDLSYWLIKLPWSHFKSLFPFSGQMTSFCEMRRASTNSNRSLVLLSKLFQASASKSARRIKTFHFYISRNGLVMKTSNTLQ